MGKYQIIHAAYPSRKAIFKDGLRIGTIPIDFRDIDRIHEEMENAGYENLRPLNLRNDFATMKFCVINETEKTFVDSTETYGHEPIQIHDFLFERRGAIAAKEFNF